MELPVKGIDAAVASLQGPVEIVEGELAILIRLTQAGLSSHHWRESAKSTASSWKSSSAMGGGERYRKSGSGRAFAKRHFEP